MSRPSESRRGGEHDCVERRAEFEEKHPDAMILTPARPDSCWRAVVPRDGISSTISAIDLCRLMDQLDQIYPPGSDIA